MPRTFGRRGGARGPNADRWAWAGGIAMGAFSALLVLTVLRDVLVAVAGIAATFAPSFALPGGFRAASAAAIPLLAVGFTVLGLVGARRRARVLDVDVAIAGLPAGLEGFTIAQISDIHVGPTIKRGYVDAIVDAVNAIGADMVAVTGDLVDGSVAELRDHTAPLARLRSRHGSYFVTGNHEYYSGAAAWVAEMRRIGMHALMNQHVVLRHDGADVVVAGVTDFGAGQFDQAEASDPHRALAGAPAHPGVKLLLAHQPRSAFAARDAGFDLQLSGHTHGGQFLPWNWFVRLQQPFTAGLKRLGTLWVYTSRGTGYWGPPLRVGAPSEITRLRLTRA
jgi:predicted MPP superfamily phosphohydrolase